jgi:hypothetical protein
MSRELDEVIRRQWRELGFYYEFDAQASEWRLVGSKSGLARFADLLTSYATDSRNEPLSEHKHYGPYFYLELTTSEAREINEHAICGRLTDFADLAGIVRDRLASSVAGTDFVIGGEYAPGAKTPLRFQVRDDNFDPASADPLLNG